MKKTVIITFLCSLLLVACSREEWNDVIDTSTSGAVFKLYDAGYDERSSRAVTLEESRYDRVDYCIVDESGARVQDIKSKYDPSTSEIHVEGLHEGDYRLLVLGIKGDASLDRAAIHELNHVTDKWLEFPADLQKPLEAEYFYSLTPFTVAVEETENGKQEVASLRQDIVQHRVVGRLDFEFNYNNPYVSTAVVEKKVSFASAIFYTAFSGDGSMTGESNGTMQDLLLDNMSSYHFMPLRKDVSLSGEISMRTRNYLAQEISQVYAFEQKSLEANHIHRIETKVNHPDDGSVVMFLTRLAYEQGSHAKILQDDERKEVYTDPSQRKFNTAQPLQLSITEEGKLHARFYSPRDMGNVLIKACIPSVSNEFFDLAYFDTIPAFADFYETVPLIQRATICHTESGRQIEVRQMKVSELTDAVFKVESTDPYWGKLQKIEHGWNIYWGLYGGDPDREDGGPAGNWMGIRPVHCREAVAFFLNFTYMIDMPEHEEILRENTDILYDDNKNPIEVEQVLRQMRQSRTLMVGLVYTGNNVDGLGGGSTYGVAQNGWFGHYRSTYWCDVMFHELGHVMGYGHNSSFTYGPWAEKLMNNFYVNHLSDFPIDSPGYLNSQSNPNRYK